MKVEKYGPLNLLSHICTDYSNKPPVTPPLSTKWFPFVTPYLLQDCSKSRLGVLITACFQPRNVLFLVKWLTFNCSVGIRSAVVYKA